jgi:hypothetical protein
LKALCAGFLFACCVLMHAQTAPPDAPQPQKEQSRLHGFIRNPPMSYAKDAPPISPGQKFLLFVTNTANPYSVLSAAASAGLSQAQDEYPSYGQGAEGYGKRFGAAYANAASTEFFGTFLFPSMMRTDPRYFRMQTGGFGNRAGYAVTRIFVTRTDSHRSVPNVPLWMAVVASGGLANTYYPESERTVEQTFSRAGISIGSQAGFNLLKEFWPDIRKKFSGHNH